MPRVIALGAIALLPLLAACREEPLEITGIDPRTGAPGETLAIHGRGFGDAQGESYVTIGGTAPTTSSYLAWSDSLITLRIPEFAESGLVYVYRGSRRSAPALYASRAALPQAAPGDESGGGPRIAGMEPDSGPVDTLVSIRGSNFGSSRGTSAVFFNWAAADGGPGTGPAADEAGAGPAADAPPGIEVSEADFGYEFWSDREIRVRVPDGAVSGDVVIRTSRGTSRPGYFTVSGMPGSKTFTDKRSYALSYSVDVQADEARTPNSLYLWLPLPVSSAFQRGARLLSRSMDPVVEAYRGASLFQLIDLTPGDARRVTLSWVAEVYAVETSVRLQAVRQGTGSSPVDTLNTTPSSLIPADDEAIEAQAAAIVGKERNPYAMARLIYDWMLQRVEIRDAPMTGGAVEALEEQRADSYRAALLFCALARAAGVPAVPLAGVLVDRFRASARHYWAEIWLDAFGWIPVDPALGAGAAPRDFSLRNDHAAWYFGSMDNQRVTFSRGQAALSRMDPRGRTAARSREFALQSLWEEAVGGLESYSSLWSDVAITGMYVR